MERQAGTSGSGPIGSKGPGETQLETDRRHIHRKIDKLREDLEDVRRVLTGHVNHVEQYVCVLQLLQRGLERFDKLIPDKRGALTGGAGPVSIPAAPFDGHVDPPGALALADEGPGVRRSPVLQHRDGGFAAGGLHQGLQLLGRVPAARAPSAPRAPARPSWRPTADTSTGRSTS